MSKNVLITGGAGFIAHHLINHILNNTDWNVVSLDRLDFSGNLNRLHDLIKDNPNKHRLKIVYHDLKAAITPLTATRIGAPDIILHLAAGSHVDRSIDYPMEFVLDNVVGTCNILDFARGCNGSLEKFIYFSTDEVFGPAPPGVDYDEYDRYNSTNPYSATKAGGEELAVAYRNTYKLPIIITHTMNVFGERQHPEKFIPLCIKKIRDGETVTIHSDPSKTIPGSRHYIHAVDVAEAIMFILDNVDDRQYSIIPKLNIVGKQEINNLELAHIIANAQGKELKYVMLDFHSARPGHDLRYSLSGQRMKNLGWEPKIDLTERIKQVVDWTLNRSDWLIT